MSGANEEHLVGRSRYEYLKFGDLCTFLDKRDHASGFLSAPISSTFSNKVVVKESTVGRDDWSLDFQSCVFQIVAEEKYRNYKNLSKAVRERSKQKAADEAAARLHEDVAERNRGRRQSEINNLARRRAQSAGNVLPEPSTEECLKEIELDNPQLCALAKSEARDNSLEQKRWHGSPVHYGDIVQLWHPYSRRFVHVSKSENALTEPSSMSVEMRPGILHGCHFKIIPRFKVRALGDLINSTDEIVLESVMSPGQYLSSSARVLESPAEYPLPHFFEISMSVSKGSFVVALYSRCDFRPRMFGTPLESWLAPQGEAKDIGRESHDGTSPVVGGMVIQLLHKDSDAYLAAEGSPHYFDSHDHQTKVNVSLGPHLRVRKPDMSRPNRRFPPTSAVTWFEVEKLDHTMGHAIAWEEQIRLKHVPTQMYLAYNSNDTVRNELTGPTYPVILTPVRNDPGTVFEVHPEIQNEEFVPSNAYIRIVHQVTRCYLHASQDSVARTSHESGQDNQSEFQTKMSRLRWDGADLRQIQLISVKLFDDAFSVNRVSDELVFYSHYIGGFLPILRGYVRRRRRGELSTSNAIKVAREINELCSFMSNHGIVQKHRQKFLRSLQIVDVLIAMLRVPFADGTGDRVARYNDITRHHATHVVMNSVFRLLNIFLTGDSRKNELFMGKHIPFLWDLYGTDMKVEPMFNELLRDNIEMCSAVGRIEISKAVDLLRQDKNKDYLEFLSVLSVIQGQPYRRHQDVIGDLLLRCKDPPLMYTDLEHDGITIDVTWRSNVEDSSGSFDRKLTLTEFARSALDERNETSTDEYLFLQHQLRLFGDLCLGRHEVNILTITGQPVKEATYRALLTWSECFAVVASRSATEASDHSPGIKRPELQRSIRNQPINPPDNLLPRSLRCVYVDLVLHLFVDTPVSTARAAQGAVENRDVLSDVELCYHWDELDATYYDSASADQTRSLSGATFEHFTSLKRWIFGELSDSARMIHNDPYQGKPQNVYLASVLRLLHKLIVMGYYVNGDDISKLMGPLKSLISGLNDVRDLELQSRQNKSAWKHGNVFVGGFPSTTSGTSLGTKDNDVDDHHLSELEGAHEWTSGGRYGDTMDENTKAVIATKYEAVKCVDSLLNFVSTVRLRLLLVDFKIVYLRTLGSERSRSKYLNLQTESVTVSERVRAEFFGRYETTLRDLILGKRPPTSSTAQVREYLQLLASDGKSKTGSSVHPNWSVYDGHRSSGTERPDTRNPTLPEVLLDAAQYNDYNLLALSMQCLHRLYTMEDSLTSASVRAQIVITPPSCRLARLLDRDIPWMQRESKGLMSTNNMIVTFSSRLLYYASQCYLVSAYSKEDFESNGVSAKVSVEAPFGRGERDESWGGIEKPSVECWLENPGGDHQINQNVIYNSGMLPIVLNVIRSEGQPALVLKSCFVFLKALCRNFNKVQLSLMESLSLILATEGRVTLSDKLIIDQSVSNKGRQQSPWGEFVRSNPDRASDLEWQDYMAQAVTEIFTGCKETCLQISTDEVSRLLELLVGYNEFAPSFLLALESVAKVEEWNLPLKRNQELIIKELMKHKSAVIGIAYIDEDSDATVNAERLVLLKESSHGKRGKMKFYHKSLVSLLAATCEGKNEQIEATCRSIFTFEELIDTVTDSGISVMDKACYVRFMLWVYLCADDASNAGSDVLAEQNSRHGDARLLRAMAKIGEEVAQYYGEDHPQPTLAETNFAFDVFIPIVDHLLAEKFFPASSGLYGANAQEAVTDIFRDTVRFLEHVEQQDTNELNRFRRAHAVRALASLERCVTSRRIGAPPSEPVEGVRYEKGHHPESHFWSALQDDFANRFRNLQTVYIQESGVCLADNVTGVETSALELENEKDARYRKYRQDYEVEIRINDEFNAFARRLHKAYGGVNMVGAQLLVSDKRKIPKGTLSLRYCGDDGEDDALPIGPEFQHFLDIFREPSRTRGDGLNFAATPLKIAIRLWDGAQEFQSTVGAVNREFNEVVVAHTLRAIRAVFHNEDLRSGTQFHLQREICRAKGILPLADLLSSSRSFLRREALAVMKWVLVDGMSEAQEAFAHHFLGTREETFFANCSALIHLSVSSILEMRSLLKQKEVADGTAKAFEKTMRATLRGTTSRKLASARDQIERLKREDKGSASSQWDPVFRKAMTPSFGCDVEENDAVLVPDHGNIRLVFCVLQSLCEGHNTVLQDYLRIQPDNLVSHNLVDQVARFLAVAAVSYKKNVGELTLLVQTLSTLTEFAQGNPNNRRVIFDLRATDTVNAIFREGLAQKSEYTDAEIPESFITDFQRRNRRSDGGEATSEECHKHFFGLMARLDFECAELLLAQIATNDATSLYIANEFDNVLDTFALLRKLRWYTIVDAITEKDNFCWNSGDDELTPRDVAFSFYALIARLVDLLSLQGIQRQYHCDQAMLKRDRIQRETARYFVYGVNDSVGSQSQGKVMLKGNKLTRIRFDKKEYSLVKVYENMARKSMSVELEWQGELQRVHFFVPKEWREQLTDEVRDAVKWSVNRDSVTDSQRDFTAKARVIIADMKHRKRLMNFSIFIEKLMLGRHRLAQLSMTLTFSINLLILISWRAPEGDTRRVEPDYAFDWYTSTFDIFATAHVIISILLVTSYFLSYPPSWAALKEQFLGSVQSDEDHETTQDDEAEADVGFDVEDENQLAMIQLHQPVFHSQAVVTAMQAHPGGLIPRAQYRTKTSILSPLSLYHLLYLVMSILGYTYFGYAFSFHLLHVIIGNQTLTRTIQAVTKNGDTLLQVFGLMIIFIYIYALLAFALLRRDLDEQEGLYCQTIFQCFTTSIRFGLISGGGLGEAIPAENYGYSYPVAKSMLFDLTFFILITTIGLNVVFGIIVDTFSELRDEKYRLKEHMDSVCFVCGENAYEFDSKGRGWKTHKRDEHNMWAYVFFFKYLDDKNPNRYTALEQYVAEQLFEENHDFYPKNRALSLHRNGVGSDVDAKLEALANDVRSLATKFELDRKEARKKDDSEAPQRAHGSRGDNTAIVPVAQERQGSLFAQVSDHYLGRQQPGGDDGRLVARDQPSTYPTEQFGFGYDDDERPPTESSGVKYRDF